MKLQDLVGKHHLGGVIADFENPLNKNSNGIAWEFWTDGNPGASTVYIVVEDENDGYRSAAAPILSAKGSLYEFGDIAVYLRREVVCSIKEKGEYGGECEVLEMRDASTGHLWLEVGTDDLDDYYPCFVCRFHPMETDNA